MSNEEKKELTVDELKHQSFMVEVGQNLHDAGVKAFNIKEEQAKIEEIHVKVRNIRIDANKLFDKITKEKAEELISKSKADNELKERDTVKLGLVPQDQEACLGGTDVLQ